MKNHPCNVKELLCSDRWEKTHPIWLCSTLSFKRNFANFLFPHKLNTERQLQLLDLIDHTLRHDPEFTQHFAYLAQNLSTHDKDVLAEHFFSDDSLYPAHAGEGFFINDHKNLLLTVNLINHLQFLYVDTRQELETSFASLLKLEQRLGNTLQYAFHPKFGFLTPKPTESGTAFTIALYLHIPATIHLGELSELLELQHHFEIECTGLQGNANEMLGDLCIAKNRYTLGISEEHIVTTMRMWATKTVITELAHRESIKKNPSEELKNKVAKAFGILGHAYQLDAIEALNILSLVQLGIDVGWIEAPPDYHFAMVFMNMRRGHLLTLKEHCSLATLSKERADYVHSFAKNMKLKL